MSELVIAVNKLQASPSDVGYWLLVVAGTTVVILLAAARRKMLLQEDEPEASPDTRYRDVA